MNRLYFISLGLLLITVACNTSKNTHRELKAISTKRIIKNHRQADFSKNTIQAKIKTHYEDVKTSQNLSIKLRIKKDQIIWMSGTFLGFPVAKVKITPTRVQYYEKINHTYFDGNFDLINKTLGTDLNFEQLQDLLLGQVAFVEKPSKFEKEVSSQSYLLTPNNNTDALSFFYWINPQNYKLNQQRIVSIQKQEQFSVTYPEYHKISGDYFPKKMRIITTSKQVSTKIEMDIRSVYFNKKLSFPFSIPEGYQEITIDDL